MPLINAPVTVGSLDWPTKGAANPANNQAQCSCWTFSINGSSALKNGICTSGTCKKTSCAKAVTPAA